MLLTHELPKQCVTQRLFKWAVKYRLAGNSTTCTPRSTTPELCFMLAPPAPPAPVASSRPPSPLGPAALLVAGQSGCKQTCLLLLIAKGTIKQFRGALGQCENQGRDIVASSIENALGHVMELMLIPPCTHAMPILPSCHSYKAIPMGPSRCCCTCSHTEPIVSVCHEPGYADQ